MRKLTNHNRNGVALIAVIILVLLGNLIVTGMIMTISGDQQVSIRQAEAAKALAAAEAGAQMAATELMLNSDEDGDGTIGSISDDANDTNNPTIGQTKFIVTATRNGSQTIITSTGTSGAAQRRVEVVYNSVKTTGAGPGLATYGKIELKGDRKHHHRHGHKHGNGGGALIDSYDSSLGPYGPNNSGSNAIVVTNSKKKDQIKVEKGTIAGNVYVGVDGDPKKVVKVYKNGEITGTQQVQAQPVQQIPWDPPNLGKYEDDFKRSNGTYTWNSDHYYKKVTISHKAVVNVQGHVTIRVKDEFNVKDSGQLNIFPGSSLTVYAEKKVEIEDRATVNTDLADPSKLVIYSKGKDDIEIEEKAELHATIFMSDGKKKMKMDDNAQFYGSFVGPRLEIKNRAQFHMDLASTSGGAGGGATSEYQLASWLERSPR